MATPFWSDVSLLLVFWLSFSITVCFGSLQSLIAGESTFSVLYAERQESLRIIRKKRIKAPERSTQPNRLSVDSQADAPLPRREVTSTLTTKEEQKSQPTAPSAPLQSVTFKKDALASIIQAAVQSAVAPLVVENVKLASTHQAVLDKLAALEAGQSSLATDVKQVYDRQDRFDTVAHSLDSLAALIEFRFSAVEKAQAEEAKKRADAHETVIRTVQGIGQAIERRLLVIERKIEQQATSIIKLQKHAEDITQAQKAILMKQENMTTALSSIEDAANKAANKQIAHGTLLEDMRESIDNKLSIIETAAAEQAKVVDNIDKHAKATTKLLASSISPKINETHTTVSAVKEIADEIKSDQSVNMPDFGATQELISDEVVPRAEKIGETLKDLVARQEQVKSAVAAVQNKNEERVSKQDAAQDRTQEVPENVGSSQVLVEGTAGNKQSRVEGLECREKNFGEKRSDVEINRVSTRSVNDCDGKQERA